MQNKQDPTTDPPIAGADTGEFPRAFVDQSARDLVRIAAPREDPSGVRPLANDPSLTSITPKMLVFPGVICPDRAMLTMISGPDAGASFAIEWSDIVLGRGIEATLRFEESSVSRAHARIACAAPGTYLIEDLGSTNGTFVGGRRIRRTMLRSGDRLQIGRECIFRFAIVDETEQAFQKRLYEMSMRDPLTSIPNRRCLFERLGGEVSHARRQEHALSLIVFDVDHFKLINDTFGHMAGDHVLRAIATRASQIVRAGDLLARYGGEEFAVVARETERTAALALADRLRKEISDLRVDARSGWISFTISGGIASLSECGPDPDGLILFARADARLYAAKLAGRDRICAEG